MGVKSHEYTAIKKRACRRGAAQVYARHPQNDAHKLSPPTAPAVQWAGTFTHKTAEAVSCVKAAPRMYVRFESFWLQSTNTTAQNPNYLHKLMHAVCKIACDFKTVTVGKLSIAEN